MNSTRKIYLHGLVASLAGLVVISGCGLLIVRLSLLYLDKAEFGLLSLLTQASAYIALVDLGLYLSFSRILIDYSTGSRERYANALKTASRVFHILGFLALLVALIVATAGASALSIPPDLHREFFILMSAQGVFLWGAFALKPLSAPLIALGKQHVVYWLTSGSAVVHAILFWAALEGDIGIYSSLVAQAAQIVLHAAFLWWISRRYLAVDGAHGRFDRFIFREVITFARDSMLWQVGGQTLASLPILLATTWFALTATADISAGMKVILLLVSLCTRFGDMAVTPLSIHFAAGNERVAAGQMTRIAGISGGIGVCGALVIVCVNPAFLSWWMLDKTAWSWHANAAGALWVAIISVTQCLYGYAVICREMRLIRWALLAECLLYLCLASAARPWAGPASLLWAKPVASILTGIVIALRLKKHTRFDTARLLPGLLRQALMLAVLLPVCLKLSTWIGERIEDRFAAFAVMNLFACVVMAAALPFLFTREVRADVRLTLHRLTEKFRGPKIHPGVPPP